MIVEVYQKEWNRCTSKFNTMSRAFNSVFCTMWRHSKSNMADGRHFENRYISISQPRFVRIWRNFVCRRKFWPSDENVRKVSKLSNSRCRTDAILKIIFLAFLGITARKRRLGDENVKFRKSNMADGRHFENRYISISQPRILRIWRNLVCRRTFWPRWRERKK